jgi:hypothetical protein
MIRKTCLTYLGMLPFGSILFQSTSAAQPVIASVYFNTPLSFNACMDRTSRVLQELGFANVQRLQTAMAFTYGDYGGDVYCITDKGIIMVVVAGPDSRIGVNHMNAITERMKAR